MHRLQAPEGLLEKASRQSLIVTSLDSHHDWQLLVEECHCVFVGDVSFQFFKRIVLFGYKVELTVLMCQLSQRNGFVSQAYRPGLNWERYPVVPRELLPLMRELGTHGWPILSSVSV